MAEEVSRAERRNLMQHVEKVYQAEYIMKIQRMKAHPKDLEIDGIIALGRNDKNPCHAHLKKELIRVEQAEMPNLQVTALNKKDFSIIKPCTVPEPCQKHPYQIVLPNEDTISTLPITKIHRELAIYALKNDTNIIASENALTCLTQLGRVWQIPFSICDTIGPDGKTVNVLVLDSEVSEHKEAAPVRMYKALRHLLQQALMPSLDRMNIDEAPTGQNIDSDDEDDRSSFDASVRSAARVGNPNISPNMVYVFGSPEAEPASPTTELGFYIPNASFVPQNAGFVSLVSAPRTSLPRPRFVAPKPLRITSDHVDACLANSRHLFGQTTNSDTSSTNSSPSGSSDTGSTNNSPSGEDFEIPDFRLLWNWPRSDESVRHVANFGNLHISPDMVYVFGSPETEPGSPRAEIGSPELGFTLPNARFVPQNAGFVSPVSPQPRTRFGAPNAEQSTSASEGSLQGPAHLSGQASTSNHMGSIRNSSSGEAVQVPDVGLRNCNCTDTSYKNLPFRSFRKWQFRKEKSEEDLEIIVHSSHKGKDLSGELLLEPQLGTSAPSPDAVRRAAMSLLLNKPACLLNVRLNGTTGKVENYEKLSAKAFAKRHRGVKKEVINITLSVLGQLQDLMIPGHYVLKHDIRNAGNAKIFAPRSMWTRYCDTDQPMEGARVANVSSAAASVQPSTSRA